MREDDLGHETIFVIEDDRITYDVRGQFLRRLVHRTQGYRVTDTMGAWHEERNHCSCYHVASLSETHRLELVEFLLANTTIKDLYVVCPGGLARGYSLSKEAFPADPNVPGHNDGIPRAEATELLNRLTTILAKDEIEGPVPCQHCGNVPHPKGRS